MFLYNYARDPGNSEPPAESRDIDDLIYGAAPNMCQSER